jgi:glyoxylase-like metal-dependent hydrolase (beta-lactamase superfamily II)
MTTRAGIAAIGLLALLVFPALPAAQDYADVKIEAIPLADGVHMLTGRGGNLAVSTGADGVFLVDDQFAPLTEKIRAAIAELSSAPLRFVVNTHWHGDHTGGNENLGKAGVTIVAHENVRARMSVEQFQAAFNRTVPAAPPAALPVITFSSDVTFHLNGQDVHVFHVDPAHTDGDSIVHFRGANVIHMGDTFFNGLYPFIDLGSGGSVDGVVAAVDRALELADAETKIIPGHGSLADRVALVTYRDMLAAVRDRVRDLIAQGRSEDEAVEARPTAAFDAKWGGGFMKPDVFTRSVYSSLKGR